MIVSSGIHRSRRAASRREVTLPCQAVRTDDFVLVADRTLDVSTHGLLLPMKSRVHTGESLVVSFQIANVWIDADATVSRVVHGRRPGDDGLQFAVVFDHLAPSQRAALAAFLHGRRAPLPRRGPLARLRRDGEAPRLADDEMMRALAEMEPAELFADESDVVDDCEEAEPEPEHIGLIRAVLHAWTGLNDPS